MLPPGSKTRIGSDARIGLAPEYYFSGDKIDVAWLEIDSITNGTDAYHNDPTDFANWIFSKAGRLNYEHILEVHQDDF